MLRAGLTALVTVSALGAMATPAPAPPPADKPAVMVLYFDNNTGNANLGRLSKGLADMLITDLSAVQGITVVERERLEALVRELDLQRSSYFDPQTAQRLGRGVGAAYAVTGAFISVDPEIRIDVRVIRVETGVVVKSATVTGRQNAFFALQRDLVARLVEGLPEALSAADLEKVRASTEANRLDSLGAAVEYGNALSARDSGDVEDASRRLQRVVTANPGFSLGRERYLAAMQELMAARARRTTVISSAERQFTDRLAAATARFPANDPRGVGYRLLRLHYLQFRLLRTAQRTAGEFDADLDEYLATAAPLVGDATAAWWPTMAPSEQDLALATDIGLDPAVFASLVSVFQGPLGDDAATQRFMQNQLLVDVGRFLVFGVGVFAPNPVPAVGTTPRTEPVCYAAASPRAADLALRAYARAEVLLASFPPSAPGMRQDDLVLQTQRSRALALFQLRRQAEAVALLQGGLDRYPRSQEFDANEKLLLALLRGDREAIADLWTDNVESNFFDRRACVAPARPGGSRE